MSKSRCHYNQPRQRWKRVSREDGVRLSRYGILRSHTFSPSLSFLPVSLVLPAHGLLLPHHEQTEPPYQPPPSLNVSQIERGAVCGAHRVSSAFIMSRSKETCSFMSSHRICVCAPIRRVGARPRRVNNQRRDFSPEFQVPGRVS